MDKPLRSLKEIGAMLRTVRRARGWRQLDLATRAGVRQASISEMENGATNAQLDTLLKVLAALNLDLATIERRPTHFDPTAY